MANILVLSKDLPFPLHSGNTLRIFHPCREMAKHHTCVLVTFGSQTRYVQELRDQKVFKEITVLSPPNEHPSLKRHFRGSDLNFVKLSVPEFYRATVAVLKEQVRRHHIDVVIAWPAILTEFVEPLKNVRKIADSCDCITLTQERYFRHRSAHLSIKDKGIAWLALLRSKNFEKALAQKHDYVVSISPVDRQRLISLNADRGNQIALIPNGIPRELLTHRIEEPELDRALVFWGNLNFPPNHSAIVFFYEKVYVPYLSGKNIKWYIVGKNADDQLRSMGEKDRNIILTGFVENLYDFVGRMPIVINPMLIGSGMKNKVMEAFALQRLVISNGLGMEAVIGAQPGVHYVAAEKPEEFAEAVLKHLDHPELRLSYGQKARELVEKNYTWDRVGEQWNHLIEKTMAHRGGYPN